MVFMHVHGLDMGDTSINSIIKTFFKAQSESYHNYDLCSKNWKIYLHDVDMRDIQ